jgi:hypothetical protein
VDNQKGGSVMLRLIIEDVLEFACLGLFLAAIAVWAIGLS